MPQAYSRFCLDTVGFMSVTKAWRCRHRLHTAVKSKSVCLGSDNPLICCYPSVRSDERLDCGMSCSGARVVTYLLTCRSVAAF